MAENLIEKVLLDNIKNLETIFVFPTQTAAQLWAERIIKKSDIKAVAIERFTAWDTFKGNSIRSKHQNKKSIPSTLRKVFAENLMEKNRQEKFLENIILKEYAENSFIFADYIANLLPSLSLWKKNFDQSNSSPDSEDKDLLFIYNNYSEFLEQNNLFDPAWETPPFEPDGNHYVIFFPEILSDYIEYEEILRSTPDITIINLPEIQQEKPEVQFFANSRIELKNIVKKLWELKAEGCSWNEIAISIPDFETYGPYLERELKINEIPFVSKFAVPLSSYGAGNFFSLIKECASQDLNYDSLKNLLLNNSLPWKNQNLIQDLLRFGRENNCICSFEYENKKINVWDKSFAENSTEELLNNFFKKLKREIKDFALAKSFSELREKYFIFRNEFLDMEECSETTDLILSRCITELTELIALQENFKFTLPSPLDFFISILDSTQYLPQSTANGVQILPYRLSAAAPFSYQIILDSSQRSLSIIYEQLNFLRDDKRRKILKNLEQNVTQQFIQLYTMNSLDGPVYFTAARKTFDGYAQSLSYLTENDLTKCNDMQQLFGHNHYLAERDFFLNGSNFPSKITATQKLGYENWKKQAAIYNPKIDPEKVRALLNNQKIFVSTSQLKSFFDCPRKWFFTSAVNLEEENNAAVLVDKYATGNLYHKILELYCRKLKEQELEIHTEGDFLPEPYNSILKQCISESITFRDKYYYNSYLTKQLLETTRQSLESTIFNSVQKFSQIFNGCRVVESEKSYSYNSENNDYICNGRIDCLLKSDKKDDYILVDFKSTSKAIPSENFYCEIETVTSDENETSPTETLPLEQQNLPDFQIPMYVRLLQNDSENPITLRNACFFDVKDGKCYFVYGENLAERLNISEEKAVSYKDFEPTINKLTECIEYFVKRNKEGDIQLNEEVQTFSKCAGCDYNPICRKTFNISNRK